MGALCLDQGARAHAANAHEELAKLVRPFVYPQVPRLRDARRHARSCTPRCGARSRGASSPSTSSSARAASARSSSWRRRSSSCAAAATPRSPCARRSRVLALLGESSLLPAEAREPSSRAAYVFLRKVEHRLQYLDDAQRHELPRGRRGPRAPCAHVRLPRLGRVQRRARRASPGGLAPFRGTCSPSRAPRPSPGRSTRGSRRCARASATPRCPTSRAAASTRSSRRWRAPPRRRRTPRARSCAASTWSRPSRAAPPTSRCSRSTRRRSSASRASSAPRAGRRSSSRAIRCCSTSCSTTGVLYAPPDSQAFARQLRAQLAAHADDLERRMALLREMHQAQVFRLLAQDLAGLLTVERLADHLSALADLVLERHDRARLGRAAAAPPRGRAALRGHRLRQARRQGARLRLRPRHHVPLRRSARAGAARCMRASRSA